jgi:SAM-dependent methyltransferase
MFACVTAPGFDDRRLSFGAAAAAYARHRPSYPVAALRWVFDAAVGQVRRVADVGAGTGALTRVLLEMGLEVTATEPDAEMLDELARTMPAVPRSRSRAERLALTDASVDAVTVGQAWHWFDKPAAAAEFTRVVRPGGVIGLLWNVRDDRVPWMGALSDLIDGEDSMRASRADALTEIASVHPGVVRADFPHTVAMTPEEVVGLVSTFSYVRLREDSDDVYAAVRNLLATHEDTAGLDVVEVPYLSAAYRIRRD